MERDTPTRFRPTAKPMQFRPRGLIFMTNISLGRAAKTHHLNIRNHWKQPPYRKAPLKPNHSQSQPQARPGRIKTCPTRPIKMIIIFKEIIATCLGRAAKTCLTTKKYKIACQVHNFSFERYWSLISRQECTNVKIQESILENAMCVICDAKILYRMRWIKKMDK